MRTILAGVFSVRFSFFKFVFRVLARYLGCDLVLFYTTICNCIVGSKMIASIANTQQQQSGPRTTNRIQQSLPTPTARRTRSSLAARRHLPTHNHNNMSYLRHHSEVSSPPHHLPAPSTAHARSKNDHVLLPSRRSASVPAPCRDLQQRQPLPPTTSRVHAPHEVLDSEPTTSSIRNQRPPRFGIILKELMYGSSAFKFVRAWPRDPICPYCFQFLYSPILVQFRCNQKFLEYTVVLKFPGVLEWKINNYYRKSEFVQFLSLSPTPTYPYPLSLFTRASWRYSSLGCSLAAPRLLSILILILFAAPPRAID